MCERYRYYAARRDAARIQRYVTQRTSEGIFTEFRVYQVTFRLTLEAGGIRIILW